MQVQKHILFTVLVLIVIAIVTFDLAMTLSFVLLKAQAQLIPSDESEPEEKKNPFAEIEPCIAYARNQYVLTDEGIAKCDLVIPEYLDYCHTVTDGCFPKQVIIDKLLEYTNHRGISYSPPTNLE